MSEHWRHSEFPPADEETEAEQRKGAVRTALVLLVIVLIIMGIAFYYFMNMRAEPLAEAEPINVLLVGVTDREADDRLDAVVLASFHPELKAVEAVALPAHTVLPWAIPDGGSPDAAAPEDAPRLRDVYGDGDAGALVDAVERLMTMPVHHTVRVDYSGFVELVDLLGGVPVENPSEITYWDEDGNVFFHLEPGLHRLNGEEALLYVRYKGTEREERRMERQWRFVEHVVAEARSQLGWDKVQPLLRIALDSVATDLDLTGATRLARIVFDSERTDYALHLLPGEDAEAGWVVDADELAFLLDEMFLGPAVPALVP